MKSNRNLIVSLATVGLFVNGFILLAGESLSPSASDMFNSFGFIASSLSIMLLAFGQKSEAEADAERDQTYRDFDAVYRHIDDSIRELRYEIKDCSRKCGDSCSAKKTNS